MYNFFNYNSLLRLHVAHAIRNTYLTAEVIYNDLGSLGLLSLLNSLSLEAIFPSNCCCVKSLDNDILVSQLHYSLSARRLSSLSARARPAAAEKLRG